MPRTEISDLDRPIIGAEAIAKVVGEPNVKKVYYRLALGLYDVDKLGRLYVSTPRRLLSQFAGRSLSAADVA